MKFKAFTISELVVAMAISAIVATIGYVAFNSIGKTVEFKSNGLAEIEQIQELRFLLKKDFAQFHDWEIINENKFQSVSGAVEYEFLVDRIIRQQIEVVTSFNFSEFKLIQLTEQLSNCH
ncbi:MAG: prepilin-type N-terminal cleavage/methylation domain-containing protein [Salibacteraceae bacterium]|jgi:prepilin-type N-terminal cleavage/methylation domain-containing protein